MNFHTSKVTKKLQNAHTLLAKGRDPLPHAVIKGGRNGSTTYSIRYCAITRLMPNSGLYHINKTLYMGTKRHDHPLPKINK
jgi:hypothetical protein